MRIPSLGTAHECVPTASSSATTGSSPSLLCKLMPSSYRYVSSPDGMHGGTDDKSVQVVFSAQSRDAIIYVTVVLIIYIVIFVVLVVTSYRKSSALRETLNRHLRFQYATGPFGTPTILESDSRGGQVHCDTVDELHEGSIQL